MTVQPGFRRIFLATLICLVTCGYGTAETGEQRLGAIHKVYIGDLGHAIGANTICQKIAILLIQTRKLAVVETPEEADAILTGVATMSGDELGLTGSVAVRLLGKSDQLLWTEETGPCRAPNGSITSVIADQVVKDLLKAHLRDRKALRASI